MKTMRIIMLACSLAAFLMADQAAIGQETKIKTTAELIAEVEASSKPATGNTGADKKKIKTTAELIAEVEAASQPATETSVVDEKAPKSAAEILAEIEALSTPSVPASAADNLVADQLASATQVASETGKELPIDSDPLPDEVIGEYAVDDPESTAGTGSIVVTEVADATDTFDLGDTESAVASDAESLPEETVGEGLFEKADALEPHLLLAGTPADQEAEALVSEKLSGRIIAEKHPLNRRYNMYRWVLKTAAGLRIPLKSNIKLLQEVRRDEILDSQVNLTGKFIQSGYSDKLRYFVVESVVVLDAEKSAEKKTETNSRKTASGKKK